MKIYTVSPLFEIQAFLTSYSSRIIYFEQFQDDEDNDDDRCVETLNSIFNFSAVFFFLERHSIAIIRVFVEAKSGFFEAKVNPMVS